jgi:hypothetical protein
MHTPDRPVAAEKSTGILSETAPDGRSGFISWLE